MPGGDTSSAAAPSGDHAVPDVATVELPVGSRVLVMSDLHLTGRAGGSSTRAADSLAAALHAWDGPGAAVLAGDCFELLAQPHRHPGAALDAHPQLTAALAEWGESEDRHVLVLPGNHDGSLAWDDDAAVTVRERLGATLGLRAEMTLQTASGTRAMRIEHGHQLDPGNAFVDPRDPGETPLGHHVVREILPALDEITADGWARGLQHVADPGDVPALIASRVAYRRLAPLAAAVVAPLLLAALLTGAATLTGASWLAGAALASALVGAVLAIAVIVGGAVWGGLGWSLVRKIRPDLTGGAGEGNGAARARAATLIAEGTDVFVTGHTHAAELTAIDGGLYANTGCGGPLLHRRPGRGPLPDVFVLSRHVSWLEVDASDQLEARIVMSHEEVPGATRLERWATRPAAPAPLVPTLVSSATVSRPAPVRA